MKHEKAIMIVNICPNHVVNFYFLRILNMGGYANRSKNDVDSLINSRYWFLF